LDSKPGKRAICLLSGGVDSTTCLAIARREGFECYCLSFDYGQRHAIELRSAAKIAQHLSAKAHRTVKIDLRVFGGSALTSHIDVPKNRTADKIPDNIPVTYVPARNTIFLAFALAYAETIGAADIFSGVNAIDYSGYPDCRDDTIKAMQLALNFPGIWSAIAAARRCTPPCRTETGSWSSCFWRTEPTVMRGPRAGRPRPISPPGTSSAPSRTGA